MRFFTFVLSALLMITSEATAFTLNSTDDPSQKGWKNSTVGFRLNPTNCPTNVDALIGKAMEIWNGVATSKLVVSRLANTSTTVAQLNGGTATDTPVIACDPNFSTSLGSSGNGIPGVALVATPPRGGNISYAYILINVESGSTGNVTSLSEDLVSIVLAHEIGHVLGLGHSPDVNALMYYNASAKTKLGLAQDDIDGITYLYPRDELSDGALGCGLVHTRNPPSNGPWAIAIWLALLCTPLAFASKLRRRHA